MREDAFCLLGVRKEEAAAAASTMIETPGSHKTNLWAFLFGVSSPHSECLFYIVGLFEFESYFSL